MTITKKALPLQTFFGRRCLLNSTKDYSAMKTMLEKLKQKFALLSKEEILETWNSGNEWDNQGLKAKDYLNHVNIHWEFENPKRDFGNVKINDILGSNLYSNLFFYNKLYIKCNQPLFN